MSVEQAKLKEMKDLIVVPNSHSFIMRDREVIGQIVYFLKNGKFENSG